MNNLFQRIIQKPVSLVKEFLECKIKHGDSILINANKNILTITVNGVDYYHAVDPNSDTYSINFIAGQLFINGRMVKDNFAKGDVFTVGCSVIGNGQSKKSIL